MKAVDQRAIEIISRIGDNAVGVEVGVFKGGLSNRLLMNKPDLFLHIVDSWATGSQEYKDSGDYHANLTEEEQEKFYQETLRNTEFAKERTKIWRMDSVEAAKQFEDKSLDFVFIDADHSYEGCKRDIEAWRPKLKDTGLLCGHDYENAEYSKFGVKKAVDELGEEVVLGEDYTWFIYEPLTVACVKWGDRYPARYVNILHAMVSKNLNRPFKFVCLTDDDSGLDTGIETIPLFTNLQGWWNKLYLFKKGLFDKGRVLYLDLDVCITGKLDEIAKHHGIILDWHLPSYNSSVMVWKAGEHTDIWDKFQIEDADRLHGDQDWISELGGWPLLPNHLCVSYRSHAQDWPPVTASVVCFHGQPKPHEYPSKWVEYVWNENPVSGVQFKESLNNDTQAMLEQVKRNLTRNLEWVQENIITDGVCSIVGGGPSLKETWERITGDVFALNNMHDWLIENTSHVPKYHVMLDSRQENVEFVLNPNDTTEYLISCVCHGDVFDALEGRQIKTWLNDFNGVQDVISGQPNIPPMLVGGGATVGLKTMFLVYLMGYRTFHFFGFDSCYVNGENHAYKQSLNDGENKLNVIAVGREFTCAAWMAKQAVEFQKQAKILKGMGCDITVHGDGLIAWVMKHQQN